jgi:thioredoxin reductase (NADPH)
MSQYLVERIEAAENIEVRLETEVTRGTGVDHLETITLVDRSTGEEEEVDANWLFVFIGGAISP